MYYNLVTKEALNHLRNGGTILGLSIRDLKQPEWCDHPDALDKDFGCSYLLSDRTRQSVKENICSTFCSMHKFREKNGYKN